MLNIDTARTFLGIIASQSWRADTSSSPARVKLSTKTHRELDKAGRGLALPSAAVLNWVRLVKDSSGGGEG